MRIVLVAVHPYPSPQAIPLANAFLKSYLAATPVDIVLRDFFVDDDSDACIASLGALRPTAIGFSMYVWNRAMCLQLVRALKRRLPDVTLFAGGPEVTADPSAVLAAAPFDFLIVGEGEQTFAEACERIAAGKSLEGIDGIAVRGATGAAHVPREPLADLDTIPSPYLSGVLDAGRCRGILWQLSRGCGFSCDFCFDAMGDRRVRRFSLQRIEEELHHFAAKGVAQVFVLDSTFNQDAGRAKAILRLIRKIARHIHFHFEVRSEFIDREMARLFAQITCSLQIGLQSADPVVLRGVGRAFRREHFAAKIALLNESGAIFGFDLMYGLPGDTPRGFAESLDFALSLYPNQVDIFPLAVLPGTALSARSGAAGLRNLPQPPYTLISSNTFSAAQLQETGALANACNIFYNRGKAVAWFNSVIAPLGLKPAAFLRQFAEWLSVGKVSFREGDHDDHAIRQLQRNFLKRIYGGKGLRCLLPLVLDLVDYHHCYASALLAEPPPLPANRKLAKVRFLEAPCRLAESARLAAFHYQILDILEAGELNVREFADSFPEEGSWAVIYPRRGEVRTESLAGPYFRLLESLDGTTPPGRLAKRLNIADEDAVQFLSFAAAEGIIVMSR